MQTIPFSQPYGLENRFSSQGLFAVVGLHVAVAFMLLSMNAAPTSPQLTTLMVSVIQPESPKESPSQAEAAPPSQKPVARRPVPKAVPLPRPQTLAAKADEPGAAAEAPVVKEVLAPAPASAPAMTEAPVTQPRFDAGYLDNPAPAYPSISRRMGEDGKVLLRVFVEPNGRPSQIQINAGSGSPRLDQAAQEAVWRWKFIPARRGNETVGAWVLVPIVFNLKG
ncbi:MAG: energy transducer TonB [Sulfuricella sp.]